MAEQENYYSSSIYSTGMLGTIILSWFISTKDAIEMSTNWKHSREMFKDMQGSGKEIMDSLKHHVSTYASVKCES